MREYTKLHEQQLLGTPAEVAGDVCPSRCAARSPSRSRRMRHGADDQSAGDPDAGDRRAARKRAHVGEIAKELAAARLGERREPVRRGGARKARGRAPHEAPTTETSAMSRAFYVTTPIYYITGNPHIGHAYTTVVADVLARTARTGGPAFFLTGTDEHGQKVANAAAAAGKTPQEWCDELVPRWKALFAAYHVEYDDFIRTTEAAPRSTKCSASSNGCAKAATSISASTKAGTASTTRRFGSSRNSSTAAARPAAARCSGSPRTTGSSVSRPIATGCSSTFRANPEWVRPRSVYNEMVAVLEEGLDDLSISRTNFDWGIPIPDGGGVIYVWFDALLNYITAIGWSEDASASKPCGRPRLS